MQQMPMATWIPSAEPPHDDAQSSKHDG